mgnify:FL=1
MDMKNRIRFVAYLSPPPAKVGYGEFADNPNHITEEDYRGMTDCGFDRAIGLFENRTYHYLAGMRQAERAGMDYLVRDQFRSGSLEGIIDHLNKGGKTTEMLLREKGDRIAARFDKYSKQPAFSGILASDEPPATKFEAIRKVQDWFKERYPAKEFIVNLLPTYANAEQLSGIKDKEGFDYEKEYVGEFIRIVQPEILSYDHYALLYDWSKHENALRPDYLRNLEVFAEYSKQTGKPFYNFMLTIGHLYYRTQKTYEDIAWQVYTSLAYGVKGLQTFTYWTLLSNGEAEKITTALVDRDGTKTPAWYAMQQVIREVRAFESEYMAMQWAGTMPIAGDGRGEEENFAQLKHPLKEHPSVKSVRSDTHCVAGFFEGEGKTAIVLANFSDPCLNRRAKVQMQLNAQNISVYRGGKREDISLTDGCFGTELKSGEGIYIALK